jgi:hypothetical protein
MTDVLTVINSNASVRNGSVVTGVTNVGRYNTIQQGINQQVPYSGAVMTVPSGYFTITDNGYLDTRFDDPTYYTA